LKPTPAGNAAAKATQREDVQREVFNGTLIGFGPYTLTLQTNDGHEVTLSKLAIAYYRRARGAA
jgi:hypothetical protein